MTFFRAIWQCVARMVRHHLRYRRMLAAITRVELAKRHAGSVLGMAWVVLQPALLLSVYVFVYMVVLRMRFEGFSRFDYVLYVFCGLVPYLGFMEALTTGGVVDQAEHSPGEERHAADRADSGPQRHRRHGESVREHRAGPAARRRRSDRSAGTSRCCRSVVVLQVMWLAGLTWMLSSITVALPDITYFVNLFVFLLMFLSPIGYQARHGAAGFRLGVLLNPIFYMTEMYRDTMLSSVACRPLVAIGYVVMCLVTFALGSAFFERFRGVLTDYE